MEKVAGKHWLDRTALLYPLLACLLGLLVAFLGAEISLRIFSKQDEFVIKAFQAGEMSPLRSNFELNEVRGYQPVIFRNSAYQRFGIIGSSFSHLAASEKKILFVGDSVIKRGRLTRALALANRQHTYDYWNAGVEGYNAIQEVSYFDDVNKGARPDLVVLTLHNNDLYNVPIVYRSHNGGVFYYFYGHPAYVVWPLLLKVSYLYRELVSYRVRQITGKIDRENSLLPDTLAALEHLKKELNQERVSLKVIIFPVIKKDSDWSAAERTSRKDAREMLSRLGIDSFDVWPIVKRALANHPIADLQEIPGDDWHPSDLLAAEIAKELLAKRFLD